MRRFVVSLKLEAIAKRFWTKVSSTAGFKAVILELSAAKFFKILKFYVNFVRFFLKININVTQKNQHLKVYLKTFVAIALSRQSNKFVNHCIRVTVVGGEKFSMIKLNCVEA